MTILRANSDNKILRGVSGEILKTPPIIDISSDYGVTKDGSNIVSKVRNGVNPNYRYSIGDGIIENGDGFVMNNTTIGGTLYANIPLDMRGKDWEYYCDFKFSDSFTVSSRLMFIYKYGVNDGTKYQTQIYLLSSGSLRFYIYNEADASIDVFGGIPYLPTYSNTRTFIKITKRGYDYYWDDGVNKLHAVHTDTIRFVPDASLITGDWSTAYAGNFHFDGTIYKERLTIL